MNFHRILAATVLILWSATASAEPEYPSAAAFVASMELSIAECSKRRPEAAQRYSALRQIVNSIFAKRNYASFIGTKEYLSEYETLNSQLGPATEAQLVEHCTSLLRLHDTPPKGVLFRE
jgi:hypothetical protein